MSVRSQGAREGDPQAISAGGQTETRAPIRVVVADDHTLYREALIGLLRREGDIEVVGEAGNGREVLKVAEEARPDVILLDLFMPEMDGPGVLRQIRERDPSTEVLIVTSYFDQELVLRTLWEGAKGFLQKSASSAELLKAIRAVHAGEAWIQRSLMGHVLDELPRLARHPKKQGQPAQFLSRREAEVATLVAEGLSNKEVADRLSISEKTVKSHLASIFRKVQVRHRLQLALYTVQQSSLLDDLSKEA